MTEVDGCTAAEVDGCTAAEADRSTVAATNGTALAEADGSLPFTNYPYEEINNKGKFCTCQAQECLEYIIGSLVSGNPPIWFI